MNPPAKISLSYITYDVVKIPYHDPNQSLGSVDHINHVLSYRDKQSRIEEVNTVLHELFHSIFKVYDLKPLVNYETEERITSAFTNGLCELFIRNPLLLKYVVEGLKGR